MSNCVLIALIYLVKKKNYEKVDHCSWWQFFFNWGNWTCLWITTFYSFQCVVLCINFRCNIEMFCIGMPSTILGMFAPLLIKHLIQKSRISWCKNRIRKKEVDFSSKFKRCEDKVKRITDHRCYTNDINNTGRVGWRLSCYLVTRGPGGIS